MLVFTHQLDSTLEELPKPDLPAESYDLVITHGTVLSIEDPKFLARLKNCFPKAKIIGCSSVGEILDGKAYENSVVYSALSFEKTEISSRRVSITDATSDRDIYKKGQELSSYFNKPDLKTIIILSEGTEVDCDVFIAGMKSILDDSVIIVGGLAGDNFSFEHTIVLDQDGVYDEGIVSVALYGSGLQVSTASSCFDRPGLDIQITKSDGNIVNEINNELAWDFYKREIIKKRQGTTGTHPIIILDETHGYPLYNRSILEVLEVRKGLLLAGGAPAGPARIVNFTKEADQLEDVTTVAKQLKEVNSQFTLAISCVVRRSGVGELNSDEAKGIFQELQGSVIGFYSFGEIGVNRFNNRTYVFNQTLTLATFYEI